MANNTANSDWIDCHDLRRDEETRGDGGTSSRINANDVAGVWRRALTLVDPDGTRTRVSLDDADGNAVSAAQAEAEAAAQAKAAAEAKALAKAAAEDKVRKEAEAKSKAVAEEKARLKAEAEAQAKKEAEAKAKAAAQAKAAALEKARQEAEAKARAEADRQAALKAEAEVRIKAAAIEKARKEAEAKAKAKAAAERQARLEAEKEAREEAERKARAVAEAKEKARLKAEAEAQAKAEAEAARLKEAKAKAAAEKAAAEAAAKAKTEKLAAEKAAAVKKARLEAATKAKKDAEKKAKQEAEEKAEGKAEAKAVADAKAADATEAKAEKAAKVAAQAEQKAKQPSPKKKAAGKPAAQLKPTPVAAGPQDDESPHSPPANLKETFQRLIRENGPISLAQYMAESNARYYTSRDPLGEEGDFITAPEVSQMFGELIGLWLADVWVRMGARKHIHYVELGPGRGTLARDAMRTAGRYDLEPQLHFVEGSQALRKVQSEAFPDATHHHDLSTLPDDAPLLIVANEFFDALPIHQLFRSAQGWQERMVGLEDGELAFVAGDKPMDSIVPKSWTRAQQGTTIETSSAASAIMAEIAQRLKNQGGVALIIDYGPPELRAGSTLQALRNHEKVDVLATPGGADLTAHVDFELLQQVAEANGADIMGLQQQGEWLHQMGIDVRHEALELRNPGEKEKLKRQFNRLVQDEQMGVLFKVLGVCGRRWPIGVGFD